MKWQMDADRIASLETVKAPVADGGNSMQAYSKKLIQYAETLYDLSERDDAWQELQPLAE